MSKYILILDDEDTTVTLLRTVLTKAGYEVVTAGNGREGLEKIQQAKPVLIISDVLMPEIDGYTFLKELRKEPATERIPILILTSRKRMEDTFIVLGVSGFIPKPMDTQILLDKVAALIGKPDGAPAPKPASEPAKAGTVPPQEEKKKAEPAKTDPAKAESPKTEPAKTAPPQTAKTKVVLIAGMSRTAIEKIATPLIEKNYQVEATFVGSDFLKMAAQIKPDLMILDVLMSDMPSKEIIKRIKRDKNISSSAILLFSFLDKSTKEKASKAQTASDIQNAKTACLNEGATSYIDSIEGSSLLTTIQQLTQ